MAQIQLNVLYNLPVTMSEFIFISSCIEDFTQCLKENNFNTIMQQNFLNILKERFRSGKILNCKKLK